MARNFDGRIRIRVPSEVYLEIAKEADDRGTSISGIIAQALTVRQTLRKIDPWESIEKVHTANRTMPLREVERVVAQTVKVVRKGRRGR